MTFILPSVVEHISFAFICSLYKFIVEEIDGNNKGYIGIVPMKLPYLIIPVGLMFQIGSQIDIHIVEAKND